MPKARSAWRKSTRSYTIACGEIALWLVTAWAVGTGKVNEWTAPTLLAAYHGLRAARRQPRRPGPRGTATPK